MKTSILVVDDEKLIRWSLEEKLKSWGYSVTSAEDFTEACEALDHRLPDLVLLDIKLPDGNGLDLLDRIRSASDDVAVIMITAEATIKTAVRAMRAGAYDYIAKPFDLDEMQVLIEKALEKSKMKKSLDYYKSGGRATSSRDILIGDSPAFREVLTFIEKISISPVPTVLLLGESGTGKNVLAKAIHNASERSANPFVTIECTTIPDNLLESELFGHEKGAFTDAHMSKKGLFELADTGTVFIDEIGDLSMGMQSKLLRVIDEKLFKRVGSVTDIEVDIRFIAATNMNLERAMAEERFRRDLYFRLTVVPLQLPPLRDREDDIIKLAQYFMEQFSSQFAKSFETISPEAEKTLLEYSWPGNVRELRNAIERAVLLETGRELRPEHLVLKAFMESPVETAAGMMPQTGKNLTLNEVEAEMIRSALREAEGNQSHAATKLGISRDVLRYRIKKYNIRI